MPSAMHRHRVAANNPHERSPRGHRERTPHVGGRGMKRRAVLTQSLATVGALSTLTSTPTRASRNLPARVVLPRPDRSDAQRVLQAIERRRSVRSFSSRPLSLAAVSQLLWAAQGISASDGRRTVPSAGALYPLELHLVAVRVEGMAPGAYRYVVGSHTLQLAITEIILPLLLRAAYQQPAVAKSAAVVVITAVGERTAHKYAGRTDRYVAFEAGAASQNLALVAAALGLGTVVIGSFDDQAMAQAMRLPAAERPVALMPIGWPD